jgi:hypothetical protein
MSISNQNFTSVTGILDSRAGVHSIVSNGELIAKRIYTLCKWYPVCRAETPADMIFDARTFKFNTF